MNEGRPLSLWHDQGPPPSPRPTLSGAVEADVAIVGGGYTGLWTAFYLLGARPDLKVALIESEFCGFGASGRNGGWASSKFPGSKRAMAADHGPGSVIAYQHATFDAIDEIGRVVSDEGIECDYRKGGMLLFATSPAHVPRLRAYVDGLRRWGFGPGDLEWLDRREAAKRAAVAGTEAAMYTPHCAALHPWRLVVGLVAAVERRGGVIYGNSRVRSISTGLAVTDGGAVRAPAVLRCTEAFTTGFPGEKRTMAPVYSLMIATEPLTDEWWEGVGLAGGETFSDERHMIVYGQRTTDGRFAFGGRGAPYHFGSTLSPRWEIDDAAHDRVKRVLWDLFPSLAGTEVTHRWGGAVAIPRDWRVAVDFDPITGLGHAGGYVGQGVTGANLAGRTLADMVAGRDTDRTRLPFVGHRPRRWEPEPLRWMGINLGRALATAADTAETRTGRPAKLLGGVLARMTGG